MEFLQFNFPSRRSNVLAENGMVVTSQTLAAQAGLDVLKTGGNAVDAAIATAATLCVVEPMSTGIGGDAFGLIWWEQEKKLYGINASGPAPAALTMDWIRTQGHDKMPERGPITVTVPGSLRGWEMALNRFGTLGLDTLLSRPIDYAKGGFPVSELTAQKWAMSETLFEPYSESRRVCLPGGRTPRAGEIYRNPEFSATLRSLAEEGIDAFYSGDIGRQIADSVQAYGGVLTVEDLAEFQAEWVEPISAGYRDGFTFHEIPPNGQGLTALLALKIASGFDIRSLGPGSIETWHILIEAMKLSFADAAAYIADPRYAPLPVDGLLSDEYTDQRRQQIRLDRALQPRAGRPPGSGDTVYLTVADGDGNMVSWIQSLYMDFGCGLTAGTTGVQLQNRGANFVLEEGHPNQVGPGKRPYHTIIPGFITYEGQAWSSFGVMGGFMQPQGHLQVGVNLVDFGMDPQSALDAPRFNWIAGEEVALEAGAGPVAYAGLANLGHKLLSHQDAAGIFYGGGQIIVRNPENGVFVGGSDPRRDGAAVGW